VAPVGDPKSLAKIMEKAVETGYLSKQGNQYRFSSAMGLLGLQLHADDKNLIIASDSNTYQQYVSGKNKAVLNNDALNQFKGKSGVVYMDIANSIKGFMVNSDTDFKQSMGSAKQIFKDVMATTDPFEGNAMKSRLEIRLNNEKQNSLLTLTGLFTDIAADLKTASKKKPRKRKGCSLPECRPSSEPTNPSSIG